jgi:hypothetical protein
MLFVLGTVCVSFGVVYEGHLPNVDDVQLGVSLWLRPDTTSQGQQTD